MRSWQEKGESVWEQYDGLLAAPIGQTTMISNWKGMLRADKPAGFNESRVKPWVSTNKREVRAPLKRARSGRAQGVLPLSPD